MRRSFTNLDDFDDKKSLFKDNENIDIDKIKAKMPNISEYLKYQVKLSDNFSEKKINSILDDENLMKSKNARILIRKGFPFQYIRNALLKLFDVKQNTEEFIHKYKAVFKGFDTKNLENYVPFWTCRYSIEESLPFHYLSEEGLLRVKEIMWMLNTNYPIIEYSPLVIKIVSLFLVFLPKEETYYIMIKLIDMNYNYDDDNLYKIRWHFRFNNFETKKLIGSLLESLFNISETVKLIYLHLYSINFPAERLFEDMALNLFIDYLNFQIVCRIFVLYMKEGVKALYRMTYSIIKMIKDDIFLIKNPDDVIETVKQKCLVITNIDGLFDCAFSLNLSRYNNRFNEQIFLTHDSIKLRNMYILPEVNIISSIIDEKTFVKLWSRLPDQFKIMNALQIYNTQTDGYSLQSIHLLTNKYSINSNIIFFILTSKEEIFGGALPCLIDFTDNKYKKPSNAYIFSITPEIEFYSPDQHSENILYCSFECFMLGGGKNGPAIYIDKDLKNGYSSPENCFRTPSLIKENKNGEFILKKMEIYLLN